MPIVVSTKDCTALSDAELVEMADLCGDRTPGFDIGFLSKERESWVLITQAREGNKLRGYSFCTLERIGGTPSLLVGLALVDRTSRAWVMRTQDSRSLERKPMSNPGVRSPQRSAISTSSASLSAVQSLVLTTIGMC